MMDIKPVRTKADRKAALRLVSRLVDLDPAPRTADADMLYVMSTLVAAYEAKHFPIGACRPH
jgi:HTH-type transcriptional regulator / antitoxin HigA